MQCGWSKASNAQQRMLLSIHSLALHQFPIVLLELPRIMKELQELAAERGRTEVGDDNNNSSNNHNIIHISNTISSTSSSIASHRLCQLTSTLFHLHSIWTIS
jgi:hypothetical protein